MEVYRIWDPVGTAIPTPVIPTPAIPKPNPNPNPIPNPIVSIASVGKAGAPPDPVGSG